VTGYAAEQFSVTSFWKTILHPADRGPRHRRGRTLRAHPGTVAQQLPRDRPRRPHGLRPRRGRAGLRRGRRAALLAGHVAQHHRTDMAQLEANRGLSALDELHRAFLTAVSHELRTPLAAILGASLTLERADRRLSEDATAELLRGLSASARRLDRMLTDLVDLERLGWGTVPLPPPVRRRRPAGTRHGPLAPRRPLAAGLRPVGDGVAGPGQGRAHRRWTAHQRGQACRAGPRPKTRPWSWHQALQPEKHRSICLARLSKPIRITCQPIPTVATRCHVIQSAILHATCTKGCSCWSPMVRNGPRVFVVSDTRYHCATRPSSTSPQLRRDVWRLSLSLNPRAP
jgi:hypothetical protein